MTRPRLVYVAPCWPAEGGSGIAMRCGLFLAAAARTFDVSLAVVPLVETGAGPSPSAWVQSLCVEYSCFSIRSGPKLAPRSTTHPGPLAIADWQGEREPDLWSADGALVPAACQRVDEATRRALTDWVSNRAGEVVLVSRLSTAALLAEALVSQQRSEKWILDIDDHDSEVALQFADLLAKAHEPAAAVGWLLEAQRCLRVERLLIQRFDATCVAAVDDVERIPQRPRCGQHAHVPNAVNTQAYAMPPEGQGRVPRILFVGSLGYLPNVYGVQWFVSHVFSRVRDALPSVDFCIAGRKPVADVERLASVAGVSVVANPDDVRSLYLSASIVVCPVFAGGGSRIKILEAFAAGVPVVSTEAGADGLLPAGKTCLTLANDADQMMVACLGLLESKQLFASRGQRARGFVEAHHRFDRVAAQVGDFLSSSEPCRAVAMKGAN